MSSIPTVIGGAGVAAVGVAAALFNSNAGVTPSVVVFGSGGALLLFLGFARTSLPRGKKGCDLERQAKFISGTSEWAEEKNENGEMVSVYRGEKATLGLPMDGDPVKESKFGLVTSNSSRVKTTYDFVFSVDTFDNRPALGRCTRQHTFKDATKPDGKPNPKPQIIDVPGKWEFLSFGDMKKQARAFGTALRKEHGVEEKQKVSIWSGNSAEWMLTDLACAAFNFTSVSVYDTLGPDAASYIVADSGSKVLVCEDKTFMKVPALLEDEIYCKNAGADLEIVVYTGKGDEKTKTALEAKGKKVIGFHDAVEKHKSALLADTPPKPEDLLTIMYTSGTTGMPKGVMLSHINIVATIGMIDCNPSLKLTCDDVHLCYLPLAHIFERQNVLGVLSKGGVIYFASSGSRYLLHDLGIARPTIFAGVPKVYENVRDAVKLKFSSGLKKTIFDAALNAKIADIETGCGYSMLWEVLFSQTKKKLGGRVRFCITGGAPISKDTLQFVLCALGPMVQGYGATETSAASSLTMCFDMNLGHVGPPLGCAAIRCVDVPDMNYYSGPQDKYTNAKAKEAFAAGKNKNGGEVWIGGPSVSFGYYDPSVNGVKPGIPSNGMKKKTEDDFFKEDGWSWFKTGDIGSWTQRGCLKIVDRRKNMFKTSLGEYVPVEEVEKTYQDNCAFADFVFLPKETKVAYVALCVVVSETIGPVMKWAKDNGVEGDENAVVSSKQFKEHLKKEFDAAAGNAKLQKFMWISKIDNIHAEYQPAGYQEDWVCGVVCPNGQREQLLTATFKARRTQLDQYFAKVFPKIYPDRPADHILP